MIGGFVMSIKYFDDFSTFRSNIEDFENKWISDKVDQCFDSDSKVDLKEPLRLIMAR